MCSGCSMTDELGWIDGCFAEEEGHSLRGGGEGVVAISTATTPLPETWDA